MLKHMEIESLRREARHIWGDERLTLEEIIIRLMVVVGDLSRIARNKVEGGSSDEAELQKELGNIIFSTIRWCDDLGYDPQACIELAKQTQIAYRQRMHK
jgi:hypothetical protein